MTTQSDEPEVIDGEAEDQSEAAPTNRYFVDAEGRYLGAFVGLEPDVEGAVEVPEPPTHADQIYDGASKSWVEPSPTTEELLAYLAERRWQAEVGGTLWGGWHLRTDEASQAKYLAELQAIALGIRSADELWKFPHGFEPISNAQMQAMAIQARQHVLQCFALEAQLAGAIKAGTITTLAEIDEAFAALSDGN
ncbi:DUF4376 domain-containing protein [Telmatospirillum sp. J64-1]|uniref:DUF4376 domain-containing protein n=1 Tax=Telmatospirillum sp. J64-1 TaxID=2502183 RepID=UPI00163DDA94|nr:DUF4376 domain-containing protein [Telmatospirillum sp. J64-1]